MFFRTRKLSSANLDLFLDLTNIYLKGFISDHEEKKNLGYPKNLPSYSNFPETSFNHS